VKTGDFKVFMSQQEICTIVAKDNIARMSFLPDIGATGFSLQFNYENTPREMLFLPPDFWEKSPQGICGGWPFLFPVCGRLARHNKHEVYSYRQRYYHLPIHGFAAQMPWEVKNCYHDTVTFILKDTPATMESYPFKFEITLEYKIYSQVLYCYQRYTNLSDVPMPYYAGFHPYFLTPSPEKGKEKVMLSCKPEKILRYNKTLTDIAGEEALFSFPVSITQSYINEKLLRIETQSEIKLSYPDGLNISLNMDERNFQKKDPLFKYIQLYTLPDKAFFCVEPWMSFPNALNTLDGVRWLMPRDYDESLFMLYSNIL
jgi:galactose mutarotase-like enzyme